MGRRRRAARQDMGHDGQEIGKRLPAARLGHRQHVAPAQRRGQRLRLHRRRLVEAPLLQVAQQRGVEAALAEAGDGGRALGGALAGDADVQGCPPADTDGYGDTRTQVMSVRLAPRRVPEAAATQRAEQR